MSQVVCAECSAIVPDAQAEITGNGWRCHACSLRHQIDVHQGADDQIGQTSIAEMEAKAGRAKTAAILAIACAVLALVAMSSGLVDLDDGSPRSERRLFAGCVIVIVGGPVFAGYELRARKRAKRAVAVMRERAGLTSSSSS